MATNDTMLIRPYQDSDEAVVAALWRRVLPDSAPHNDPALSIRNKMKVDPELFLVAEIDDHVVGTVMGGYDGHRGWAYSVAVDPDRRRQGIGSHLLDALESILASRGCVKLNLQVRADNKEVVAFYANLGFIVEPRVSMGKRLYGPR